MGLFEERSVLGRRNRMCKCPEAGTWRTERLWLGDRMRAGTPGAGARKGWILSSV